MALLCNNVMQFGSIVGIKRETEGVGFEPTVGFPTLDFESSALNRTQPPFQWRDIVDPILGCAILRRPWRLQRESMIRAFS